MTHSKLLARITARPDVFGGKPIVRDMRISVELILSLLAQGVSQEDLLEDYPRLEPEDIRACLAHAHAVVAGDCPAAVSVAGEQRHATCRERQPVHARVGAASGRPLRGTGRPQRWLVGIWPQHRRHKASATAGTDGLDVVESPLSEEWQATTQADDDEGRMAPTILRERGYRLFFFSREESRPHVHVETSDGEAKFWLDAEASLANNFGLSDRQLRQAKAIVKEHRDEIRAAWRQHFGG